MLAEMRTLGVIKISDEILKGLLVVEQSAEWRDVKHQLLLVRSAARNIYSLLTDERDQCC